MLRIFATLAGIASLSCATAASAEFPANFPARDYTAAGISVDGKEKVYIDRDPSRYDDSVSGALTVLFLAEQTHRSGRRYWARRTGFMGHCTANTIGLGVVSGYEHQNGVIQFSDDMPNPPPPLEESAPRPKSLGDIVLSAACKR